jgi:2'-5' RNA ligase
MRDDEGGDAAARWRLIAALPVPPADALAIHGSLAAHRAAFPDARWLAPTLYHVTLRFLGSVDAALAPQLAAAVGQVAGEALPFQVVVGRGGGARGRSEVAWLEVLEGRDRIETLADRFDDLLPPDLRASLRPGRRAPHLTIARRAPAALARGLADGSPSAVRVAWDATRMTLFRSHTGTPTGSRYEPLVEAQLGGHAA